MEMKYTLRLYPNGNVLIQETDRHNYSSATCTGVGVSGRTLCVRTSASPDEISEFDTTEEHAKAFVEAFACGDAYKMPFSESR